MLTTTKCLLSLLKLVRFFKAAKTVLTVLTLFLMGGAVLRLAFDKQMNKKNLKKALKKVIG